MDKGKIGNFIGVCRKERKLTQEQLGGLLNVSGKSVSKWENGCCLPDAALFEPLCAILGISINELFAGQRISDAEYKSVADQNLLQMLKHKMYSSGKSDITFSEFDNALSRIAELTVALRAFPTKESAVDFWVRETGATAEECSRAYDFYINLFQTEE